MKLREEDTHGGYYDDGTDGNYGPGWNTLTELDYDRLKTFQIWYYREEEELRKVNEAPNSYTFDTETRDFLKNWPEFDEHSTATLDEVLQKLRLSSEALNGSNSPSSS